MRVAGSQEGGIRSCHLLVHLLCPGHQAAVCLGGDAGGVLLVNLCLHRSPRLGGGSGGGASAGRRAAPAALLPLHIRLLVHGGRQHLHGRRCQASAAGPTPWRRTALLKC